MYAPRPGPPASGGARPSNEAKERQPETLRRRPVKTTSSRVATTPVSSVCQVPADCARARTIKYCRSGRWVMQRGEGGVHGLEQPAERHPVESDWLRLGVVPNSQLSGGAGSACGAGGRPPSRFWASHAARAVS